MNVVVICSDTFRYDHLGFLGQQNVLTPNLDKLARESASFSDFQVCSFPTLVNRIEVFSGRYTFPLIDWGPLPHHHPVLAEVFKRHGFATALVTDNLHLMQNGFGFGRGFDVVKHVPGQMHDRFQPRCTPMLELPCTPEKIEARPKRLARYRRNAWWYRQHCTNTAETVFRESMEWLAKPPDKFFLWIDTFDPHEPWDAPSKFQGLYPLNQRAEAVFWPHSGNANRYSKAELENMRSLYRAEVSQTDYWVGQLLDNLQKHKVLDNTAVIFCSDHGYYFGEHGLVGKPLKRSQDQPTTIYDELGHLPLLIRHPDGVGAGKTIPGLCQPPDLFATALDLAGISPVAWMQGTSLIPRLSGAGEAQPFAVSGCHPHKSRVSCLTVLTDEWCLVYSPTKGLNGSELFHRLTDPVQKKNVIADHPAAARELFEKLTCWLNELKVPPARQRQLLHAEKFGWLDRARHRFWMLTNRAIYKKCYLGYVGGGLPLAQHAQDSA